MIDKLQELGYAVGWAQGATPPELRDKHRAAGWAWEGDTHVEHHVHVKHVDGEPVVGPVPIQHFDAEAAGFVPEHMVLRDDSHEPTILHVSWPVDAEQADGTPIPTALAMYVREDDDETWRALLESHDDRQAELEKLVSETPDETAERRQREAEERAAEDA